MPLIEAAGTELAQHVGVGAKLVIRENLQVEPAIGLGLDRHGHFTGTRHERMRFREVIGELVGKFGRLRPRHKWRADARNDR